MSDQPPDPFDTVGDEHVEARVVAWVLGEASAFEAAELERLCAGRPELEIFRRRIHAVHELVGEATTAGADPAWRLPPEKRFAIDAKFGPKNPVISPPENEIRIRRSARRVLWGIAACVLLTGVVIQMVNPVWVRQSPLREPEIKIDFMPSASAGGKAADEAETLELAVRNQEDKVEERRKNLAGIARTKGIVYRGQDFFHGQNGVDEDQGARNALDTYNELAQQKLQYESQLESLQKYGNEQLIIYASNLDLPDNTVKVLYPQYQEARRKLESGALAGLGGDDPNVKSAKEQIDQLKRKLDGGVTDLRTTLKNQLAQTDKRLSKVEVMKSETRDDAIKRGLDAQDYVDAKRDYETDVELLSKLKAKQAELNASDRLAGERLAANEPPAPPAAPASRSYAVESAASGGRELNMRQTAGQNQLARRKPAAEATKSQPALPEIARADEALMDRFSSDSAPSAGSASGLVPDNRNNIDAILINPNVKDKQAAATMNLAMKDSAISANLPTLSSRQRAIGQPMPVPDLGNEEAKLELGKRDAPIRSNPALTEAHQQNVDQIRRGLYTAEGNFNLGKFGEAKKSYEEVLRTDPDNSAARRGMEQVAGAKSDYYRAAYDNSRAELLAQVDKAWELKLPADQPAENDASAAPAAEPAMLEERPTAPTEPAVGSETSAAEDPYSTFSLNVSDASFQLAKDAVEKGGRPDPAQIKPEQFYNAVDYGDPAPGADQPVAATVEQCAHPVIPGRNLVRVALRTASGGRGAAQALRLTLLVDQSGSMVREDRRAAMDHALGQLGGLLTANDRITIVGFSRTPHLLAESMSGAEGKKVGEIINQASSEGGTNLEEAMKLAAQLAERHQLAGAQNRIVLFTDGAANLGNADPDKLEQQVKALRQKGIAFDIAGIGTDGLNDRLLAQLARHGNGRYYVVGAEKNDSLARQLAGAFRPAAENVKVQVRFNPQRVGNYQLIGFEKDRLKTEDFRNDAVDAAELAADEAGVALYQVEPLPGGGGEIGEVSVRFRDVASGEMVERAWTIPYDESATAFDRATPSMQLAGLAMMAAEKLGGGPAAAIIDFKQFAGSIAQVKQFYAQNARVAEMLRLINAL